MGRAASKIAPMHTAILFCAVAGALVCSSSGAALSRPHRRPRQLVAAADPTTTTPDHDFDAALAFLLEHQPARDNGTIPTPVLHEGVRLALHARKETSWGPTVPWELFLNDVLPYASLAEPRENWRPRLHALCAPLVANTSSPGEAALRLNSKLWPLLNVSFKPLQSPHISAPFETMVNGFASCTGLAILLVDACRSVGVPARVVAVPEWVGDHDENGHPQGGGNHAWVEVWSDGGWSFTGAAEPEDKLNATWFHPSSTQRQAPGGRHGIYASSWKPAGAQFPVGWEGVDAAGLNAEDVTQRYLDLAAAG